MVLMPQPQFLHQAVLQREVGALGAALGWTAVRTPCLDIELVHRAAKLRDTACAGAAVHRPEYARAVAVERNRLAVAFEVRARHLEVTEGRFGHREVQHHQTAGRIVDIHEQRARGRAILEPGVLAAVDLDQLTGTGTPGPWLVDLRCPLAARNPQAGGDHQRAYGLDGHLDAVRLMQLLASQRRPEVRVAFPYQCQRMFGLAGGQLVVTRHVCLKPGRPLRIRDSASPTVRPAARSGPDVLRHGLLRPISTMAWMTFNRSSSRIVLVIIPVAFIPGAPRKGSIQHALAPDTRHFYLAETRHFNFGPTKNR